MAEIAPLTPLRYDLSRLPGGLAGVVAPPYDVISKDERVALAARDPHNVVRLILPEGEGDAKYGNAARILAGWREERILVRDEAPGFYRYDQTFVPPAAPAASPPCAASRPRRPGPPPGPSGTPAARRAPLLHAVPRQRRRPDPRRLPHAPARALARVVLVRGAALGGSRLVRRRGAPARRRRG